MIKVLMSVGFMILVHIKLGPEEDLLELTGKPYFPLSKKDLLEKSGCGHNKTTFVVASTLNNQLQSAALEKSGQVRVHSSVVLTVVLTSR